MPVRPRKRPSLSGSTSLFVLVACLAVLALEAREAWVDRRVTLDAVARGASNLASALNGRARDLIDLGDAMLISIAERVSVAGVGDEQRASMDRLLTEAGSPLPEDTVLAVFAPDGSLFASSLPRVPLGFDAAEAEFFKLHRDRPDLGLHIGTPLLTVLAPRKLLTLSRRVTLADGSFGGVVVIGAATTGLVEESDNMDVGQRGLIAALRSDGTVLTTYPYVAEAIGGGVGHAGIFGPDAQAASAGTFIGSGIIDGEVRSYSYKRAERYPLIFLVGIDEQDALAGWRSNAIQRGIAALGLALFIGLLGSRLFHLLKRREADAHALEESEQLFRLLAERSGDMVLRIAPDRRLVYVSPASIDLLGLTPAELLGRSVLDEVAPEDRAVVEKAADTLHAEGSATVAFRLSHRQGRQVWVEASVRPLLNPSTREPDGAIAIARDITARKAAEQALQTLATTDALTGLANRRSFDAALAEEWERHHAAGTPLSLLLIDLDRFKLFNDTYGHQAGDDCLRAVSGALAGAAHRTGDVAARYGGEELVAILPNTSEEGAIAVAQAMHDNVLRLAITHRENPPAGRVSVSIGIATARDGDDENPAGLIERADKALYQAKARGRNRSWVADAPRKTVPSP
ncbi:sensor domain-containing diguanylate cyclase [Roseococcus sp. YIM B11640]|uniref:sensor domain-containing diguanylate cyclase n=1 Tax=Roseococcus sp. YIM B11640 TaxID=3133973 RepID=UPI003C7D4738